jgi:hypothetical protein
VKDLSNSPLIRKNDKHERFLYISSYLHYQF